MTRAEEIRDRGFTVFDGAFSADEVAFLRASIERRYDGLGRPETFARPPLEPAPDVEIAVVGLVLYKLGVHCPELAPHLLKPDVVGAARDLLGEDMHLEFTSAVIANGERPFFPWHVHIGGVDNVVFRKEKLFPSFERSERATLLLYLDDLTPEAGTLLVYPRRVSEPTRPPHDPNVPDWPGMVELRCSRGTVVMMEQCTWHAARPKSSAGLRAYIACYFTSSVAKKTSWVDESLRPWAKPGSLLASVLSRS
jgi:Phytanoyl-CoA dioxygenase (PhyH)